MVTFLRIIRTLAGVVFATQVISLLPALEWLFSSGGSTPVLIVQHLVVGCVAGTIFVWLRGVINNVYTRQHGLPHPSLSKSSWTL